ncbi:hypothetical protein GCM10009864_07390 [Streptomyces lunalinharesii]|uniref:Uncharacterized protein n=1 Tax=Streptomyces lunalinharesii TaxID=333384 RepID=A0ABN3R9H2_9ACTN
MSWDKAGARPGRSEVQTTRASPTVSLPVLAEAGLAVLHAVRAAPAAVRAASARRVRRALRDACIGVVSCPTVRAARLASPREPTRYPTGYGDQAATVPW